LFYVYALVNKVFRSLTYFNHVGEETLNVACDGPGIKKKAIGADALFHITK